MIKPKWCLWAVLVLSGLLVTGVIIDQTISAAPPPALFGRWMIDDRNRTPIPSLGTCIVFQPTGTFTSYAGDVVNGGTYRFSSLSRSELRLVFRFAAATRYTISVRDQDHFVAQDGEGGYAYSRFTGDLNTCFSAQGRLQRSEQARS